MDSAGVDGPGGEGVRGRRGCRSARGTYFATFPPFGLANTSSSFSFGSRANGLYSGSPTSVIIQLVRMVVRA